jgi:hypothetical protein
MTTPSIGAVMTVFSRLTSAWLSEARAWVTCALADRFSASTDRV